MGMGMQHIHIMYIHIHIHIDMHVCMYGLLENKVFLQSVHVGILYALTV